MLPVVNRTYFSMMGDLHLFSQFTNEDQFECKWELYEPPTTNDFKSEL